MDRSWKSCEVSLMEPFRNHWGYQDIIPSHPACRKQCFTASEVVGDLYVSVKLGLVHG